MEVIPLIRSSATGSEASNGDNGIKRRVQEWSRLDRLTGILEHARVEADQWTNHTANTKHKYGKVVDRRARNLADGSKEETQQTKQLEVFQAHTAGCSVQVIRSQTSTTSSWHNSSTGSSAAFQWPPSIFDKKDNQFDQLRLDYSPLDVSSQKSKASVGRSGSISTRRPPTRRPTQTVAVAQLPEVESDAEAAEVTTKTSSHAAGHEQHQRRGADATAAAAVAAAAVSTNLNRLKSCSSDEIRGENNHHRHHHHHNHNNNNNDNNDIVNNHIHNNNNNHNNESSDETSLDRSSRFRRSLQFAQLRRTTQDSQQHRISGGGELEDVLKKVLGKKLRAADGDDDDDADEVNGDGDGDDDRPLLIKPACPSKKPSFVTVECLKKTKNSLRHLNGGAAAAGEDDGIDADDAATTVAVPAAVVGDSRSLDYRGSALARTEEWYNRRKSYGFEKVHNTTASSSSSDGGKYAAAAEPSSAMDSSTDSGICRSTENGLSNSSRQSSVDREPSIADLVKKYTVQKEINNNVNGHGNGNAAAYTTTVVAKGKILEAINSLRSKSSAYFDVVKPGDAVVSTASKENGEQVVRRLSVGIDLTADKSIVDKDDVPKRHSIAVVSDLADREPSADKKNANKKVEFCRTEVHFDATPGKINIVDMEDKPAPAQLYRPKKRYNRQSEKSHALPEYRFGDDVRSDIVLQMNGNDGNECTASSAEDDNNNKPRSILKRQQQQQQQQQQQLLQKNVENSGGVASDNGIEVRISSTESTPVDCRRASWSVADRVKQVEAVGFSTRVNFTEGETTAVGFDPADPGRPNRYSYNGTASPVWYQNNGNSPSTADGSAAKRCHEKLLVRIGGAASASAVTSSSSSSSTLSAAAAADLCAFSKRFSEAAEQRLSSTSLVMMNTARFRAGDQPSTYLEEMNTKMQGRLFQKAAASTSWPRCGHKTYPTTAACRKYNLLKSCADIRRERAAATASASADDDDVIGALDDLSKTIDAQIVDHRRRGGGGGGSHVTLIKVRQPAADEIINGRLEYAKDLMSTDETSEESLKADEEVRSYMMAASDDCTNDDDDCPKRPSDRQQPLECDNLKKLISTVEKKVNRTLQCSQADGSCGRAGKTDAKSYESALTVPNVTSVLLNHRDGPRPEPERSPFQPVSSVLAAQVANAAKRHRAEDGDDDAAARHKQQQQQQQQPAGSKRVPVKIVQDNRAKSTTTGNKPKTEVVAKTAADVSAAKSCAATVSLKQVPMTVQPKPASVEKKKPAEKKESIYGNVAGCRAAAGNGVAGHGNGPASNGPASNGPMNNGLVSNGSLRAKDRPSAAASRPAQDLFSTGRDSWLNMPKDLGPKLNRSKAAPAAYAKGPRGGRREPAGAASTAPGPADSDLSVLEQLNRAADEILKAVDGYTDDEQQQQQQQQQRPQQQRPQQQQKQRRRADDAAADTSSSSEAKLKNKKKAARLLQRANSREALLQLDGASSSDEDAAALDEQPHCRVKPKTQRKTRQQQQQQQQHDNLGVAAKTTASFTKKIQSRVQNVTKTNVQHKVHPTYYGNVSSCTQTSSMRFRNKPSDCLTKQAVDQKDVKSSRYQCKITTTRTFNSKKVKGSAEESNKNSIKGC